MNYILYDTEITGTDTETPFDQISQFAVNLFVDSQGSFQRL